MKYMGSKKNMILNGLGNTFSEEINTQERIIDLFSGSAAVTWYLAENFHKKVVSVDLQKYSQILADSVLKRTSPINVQKLWDVWYQNFSFNLKKHPLYNIAFSLDQHYHSIDDWAYRARKLCAEKNFGLVWKAYGGYYFSPLQALKLDLLLSSIPFNAPERYVAHASVIIAASKCSASPGHTAQPFKPNKTAGKFLEESWKKDPVRYAKQAFFYIGKKHSKVLGESFVMDALDFLDNLTEKDLVFIDPPYSGVHYSRFYHVLETIARIEVGAVSGAGRYPPQEERPFSTFSRKSESVKSFRYLIKKISEKGIGIILTYPFKECSNGLSGENVLEICSEFYSIKKKFVYSNFSTLGGNGQNRLARNKVSEMILVLKNN